MWSLLPRQVQVLLIVGATLLIALTWDAVTAAMTGTHTPAIKLVSPIASIIGIAVVWVVGRTWRWLWRRFPFLGRLAFPDLNGCWTGNLVSNWVDSDVGRRREPIPATIRVFQGLFDTTVTLKTGESTSTSKRAHLVPFREAGRYRIWYSYDNEPMAQVGHRSSRHEGVSYLDFEVSAPEHLVGRYYTDRGTMGDITVTRSSRDPNA